MGRPAIHLFLGPLCPKHLPHAAGAPEMSVERFPAPTGAKASREEGVPALTRGQTGAQGPPSGALGSPTLSGGETLNKRLLSFGDPKLPTYRNAGVTLRKTMFDEHP